MSGKFTKVLLFVLLALCAVALIVFYVQNSTGFFALSNIAAVMATNTSMLDAMMLWAYLLVFVTVFLLLVFTVVGMVKNPKSLKKSGITVALAVVLIVVSYFLASGDPVDVNIAVPPSASTLKWTDTGLVLTYILFAVSVIALIFGGVRKLIQNR